MEFSETVWADGTEFESECGWTPSSMSTEPLDHCLNSEDYFCQYNDLDSLEAKEESEEQKESKMDKTDFQNFDYFEQLEVRHKNEEKEESEVDKSEFSDFNYFERLEVRDKNEEEERDNDNREEYESYCAISPSPSCEVDEELKEEKIQIGRNDRDIVGKEITYLSDIITRENKEISRLRSMESLQLPSSSTSLLKHTQPFTSALISYHETTLKTVLIQRHIALLLHAHKCQGSSKCNVAHCSDVKDVLLHLRSCNEGKTCPFLYCYTSRQILCHWKTCDSSKYCTICTHLRQSLQSTGSTVKGPFCIPSALPSPSFSSTCSTVGLSEDSRDCSEFPTHTTPTKSHQYNLRKTILGKRDFQNPEFYYFQNAQGKSNKDSSHEMSMPFIKHRVKRSRPNSNNNNNKQRNNRQITLQKQPDKTRVLRSDRGKTKMAENDDPHKLWCLCRRPHNNRMMICCDKCEQWFHITCIWISKAEAQRMERDKVEWFCPFCNSCADK